MLIGVALDDDDDDYDLLTLNQPRAMLIGLAGADTTITGLNSGSLGLNCVLTMRGQSGSGVTVPVSGLSHPIDFCIFTYRSWKKKDGIFSTPVDIF